MKYNRLNNYGLPDGVKDRQVGRSTGLALTYIGSCLSNPGKAIKIKDHKENFEADEYLFHMVIDLINELGLREIIWNNPDLSITYELYGQYTAPDRIFNGDRVLEKVAPVSSAYYDGCLYE